MSPARNAPLMSGPVAIAAALHKRGARELVRRTVRWLKAHGRDVLLRHEVAASAGLPKLGYLEEEMNCRAAFFLSLGGDGTLLATARLAAPGGKPILGVNLGGFGFLAEIPPSKLFEALELMERNGVMIEDRLMLAAEVWRRRALVRSVIALNDVAISNSAVSHLLHLRTCVSGAYLSGVPADGLVIATPTGSTGYSLSAGGPVMHPALQAIILTPICAHTLSARPLVIPPDQVIEVTLGGLRSGQEAVLTTDGQEGFCLRSGDLVRVRKADFSARLIKLSQESFYPKLRTKLKWGGQR